MDIYYSSHDQSIRDFSAQHGLEFEVAYAIVSLRGMPQWEQNIEDELFSLKGNFSRERLSGLLRKFYLNDLLEGLCLA